MILREQLIGSTLVVDMVGEVEGENFVEWRCDLSRRYQVDGLHVIYDLRAYTGGIDHEHVSKIAEAIREPLTDRWTVIVSQDRGMELWAKAIALAYPHAIPGRRFAVTRTMPAAHNLLLHDAATAAPDGDTASRARTSRNASTGCAGLGGTE